MSAADCNSPVWMSRGSFQRQLPIPLLGMREPGAGRTHVDPPWAKGGTQLPDPAQFRGKPSPQRRQSSALRFRFAWVWVLALAGCVAWATFEYTALPDARELADRNPETTALMDARNTEALAQGRKPNPQQVWVPLSSVAQSAVDAVLISEDASFYVHHGIDFDELKKVLTQAWETRTLQRGASTITMQLAKNLWLTN